jgi:hypothetical protein
MIVQQYGKSGAYKLGCQYFITPRMFSHAMSNLDKGPRRLCWQYQCGIKGSLVCGIYTDYPAVIRRNKVGWRTDCRHRISR